MNLHLKPDIFPLIFIEKEKLINKKKSRDKKTEIFIY